MCTKMSEFNNLDDIFILEIPKYLDWISLAIYPQQNTTDIIFNKTLHFSFPLASPAINVTVIKICMYKKLIMSCVEQTFLLSFNATTWVYEQICFKENNNKKHLYSSITINTANAYIICISIIYTKMYLNNVIIKIY